MNRLSIINTHKHDLLVNVMQNEAACVHVNQFVQVPW